jgi:hypothetical protein
MNISNLKDLKKLMQLCQSMKIKSIEIDGIKMELNDIPDQPKRSYSSKLKEVDPGLLFPQNGISSDMSIPAYQIATDELTEEQMLFYSAADVPSST